MLKTSATSPSLRARAELCRANRLSNYAMSSLHKARTVVIELTEVRAIEGGGLGMLVFLQRWARDHNIRLKLFNPSRSVRERLELVSTMSEFDIASLHEM